MLGLLDEPQMRALIGFKPVMFRQARTDLQLRQCLRPIYPGAGESQDTTAFAANYKFVEYVFQEGIKLAKYTRCVTGKCQIAFVPGTTTAPAYQRFHVISGSDGVVRNCLYLSEGVIASCSTPLP